MIIKLDPNKTSNDPKALIHHLLHKPEDNEQILLVQGSESAIKKAWSDARFEKVKDAAIHIKLNPAEDEWMNDDDWTRGLELLAQEIGFNPLSATVVQHTKKGRTHQHIIVPMLDMGTGKKLNLWRYKFKCMAVAKKLELEFKHYPTPARDHTKRYLLSHSDNMPSDWAEHVQSLPDARESYSNRDMQKAKRYGYELPELRDLFTSLIEQSDSVKAFKSALRENGFELIEKGKRNRAYFRAIDTPDLELNATKLLGVKKNQLDSYLKEGNKNELFNKLSINYRRKRLSNSINTSGNRPSGVLDKQANKEEPAITQTIPDATTPAEPPVSIIQSEPDYQSDEGHAGKRQPFICTAEHDHGNTGNSNSGSASDSGIDGRNDAKRGWGRQSNSHHSGKPDNADRDVSEIVSGPERTERGSESHPTGTARAGQNVKTDGTCVDPAITEQQRDLNKRLSGLLKRVSGMSSLEHGKRTLYGLNSGWNGWVSIPYENVLTCRSYELSEDAMREMVDHWKKRSSAYRSPVSSASPVMKNGSARMKIEMRNGDVFYDDGQQLTSTGPVSQQTAREIVLAAKAKGWSFVEITGSQQYKDEIAIQCKLQGISCNHPLSPAAEIKYNRIERKIFDNNMKRLSDTVQLQK